MLVCGVEEPLQINEMLYALDEASGRNGLSEFRVEGLNRYSFVWLGAQSLAEEKLAEIAWAVLPSQESSTYWLFTWQTDEAAGIYAYRAKVQMSRRRNRGWMIYQTPNLAIGAYPVSQTNGSLFQTPEDYPLSRSRILIASREYQPANFLTTPFRASIEQLADRQQFSPSAQFLAGVKERGTSIAYLLNTEVRHAGLVLVCPQKLPINELAANGKIWKAWYDAEAGRVWRFGSNPNFS